MSKLVIVESPTKAKTISRILDSSYKIVASMWHVRDLPEREIGVDIEKIRNVNLKIAKKFATETEITYIFGKIPEEDDFSLDVDNENESGLPLNVSEADFSLDIDNEE